MSLKQFLAVGKSFAGSPREKSPFEMRKNIRLPQFENAPRFTTKPPVPVQADWLKEQEHVPLTPGAPTNQTRTQPKKTKAQRKNWLELLTFGLLGRQAPAPELIQEEMVLENVRVIRNDLADSDLEVVKRKKFSLREVKTPQPEQVEPASPPVSRAKKREEWTRLTATLFTLGQH